MDWRDLPDDIRMPLMRFVEAACPARIELTSFDLQMVLPSCEISAPEVEVILAYIAEHGIQISPDHEE